MPRPRLSRVARPVAVAVLACVLAAGPPATARDLSGRVGLGLEQSLAGATGFAFRYYLNEAVGVAATLGVDLTLIEGEGGDNSLATGLTGSLGVSVHLARSLHAHFGFGLRLTVGWRSLEAARLIDPDAVASDVHFAIELPLLLEFFLSDHFSVGVASGILFNFVPASGSVLATRGNGGTRTPSSVGIGLGAGAMTTFAVLYYF